MKRQIKGKEQKHNVEKDSTKVEGIRIFDSNNLSLDDQRAWLQEAKNLHNIWDGHDVVIETMVSRPFGLSGWFKAFIKSEEWKRLTPEYMDEAFNAFEVLTTLLDQTYDHNNEFKMQ